MYQKRTNRVHTSLFLFSEDSRALLHRFSFLLLCASTYIRSLRQRTIQTDLYLCEFPFATVWICDEKAAIHSTLLLEPLQFSFKSHRFAFSCNPLNDPVDTKPPTLLPFKRIA